MAVSRKSTYPYRFECVISGTRSLKLYKQDNFPEWDSSFLNKKIAIYVKYTITDSKTGNSYNWQATAYTTDQINNDYRVSLATGNFPIIEYKSPEMYKIDFLTKAFNKRTCRTESLCMLYGYLLPSTLISETQISYMTFTLAPEFGYSSITTYDSCAMQEKNDDYNPVTCTASRNDSDFTIKFVPQTYNHNYKLINIDTSTASNLFLSPKNPGPHYQTKVNLFSSSDVLLESMMVNLTKVYGSQLAYADMSASIPMDA